MPPDVTMKAMNAVHRLVLRLSGGRLGWKAGGMPVLELTTVGRRSGEPRSVMLTSPLQEGDTLVVVASRGGDDRHPAWFLNLVADPHVVVTLPGRPGEAMTARVIRSTERAELFERIVDAHPNYGGYQKRTRREIPVVILSPASTRGEAE